MGIKAFVWRPDMESRQNRSPLIATMACLCLLFLAVPCWAQAPVKMWVEPLVIPTYPVGAPELNPIFYSGRGYQGAKGPIYPYPLIDKLTSIKEDKPYQAVYLENRYTKLSVLPEIGGRIFAGVDKTNNYDFFYRQHVIKPALIGMIGAWISGGVEWNIPHHHRASTFLPVDYKLVDNPDGSKTIWVGEMELRHRMRWIVGLTLYPDRSYIEATVKLFNRTPFVHSILYFANVAVYANPDYQVIFPPSTQYGTQHSKVEFVNWPVGQGRYAGVDRTGIDLSWWKNHPTPVSIFAWNYEDDFFGGYDHGKQAGVVHVADRHVVPGKKFFEFANGPEGRMWDKILTDTDGPYLELMAGAYSDNQPDYSWIQPYEVKTIKQYWYPIRQLGGIKNANLDAAVNLDVNASSVARFAFNATSEFPNSRVLLQAGDKVLFEQAINIGPAAPFAREFPLPPGIKPEDLKVALMTSSNKELISYKPARLQKAPMPEPVKPPPAPQDIKSNEELYLAGQRLEQFYNPAREPYPYYEEALKRDPGDSRVNTALGILYCKRGMFKEAEERLKAALQRLTRNYTSPKDGEAFYYLGVALRAQAKGDAACEAFHKATWSNAWHGAANVALAETAATRGRFSEGLEFIDRAISSNALNTKALNLKAALLRRLGHRQEAETFAAKAAAIDPLDLWAANERLLAQSAMGRHDRAAEALKEPESQMRGGVQSYLELAVDYGNCGFLDEAIGVLTHLVDAAADKNRIYPMVHYYIGYYWEKKGDPQKASEHYRLAGRMPSDYCFPFRLESIAVLESAIRNNPADARAPYYLGNLLYDLQPENAIKAWEASRKLDNAFAIVHRNLGLAYARVENDAVKAIASLEQAVARNPGDSKLYAELDALYEIGGINHQKRLALLEQNHATVEKRDDALAREIALTVLLGNYDKAINLLDGHHFHLWEGQERGVHELYVDAHLLRGEGNLKAGKYPDALKDFEAALEYPDRFETARPYRGGGREPQIHYYIGTAYAAMGDQAKAKSSFEKALSPTRDWSELSYYQGLAHRKLGREAEANAIFDGLIRYGQERLAARPTIDFFAKFGAQHTENAQKARLHYLVGLGHLGKGNQSEARSEASKALELDMNHLWASRLARGIRPEM